MLDSPNDAAMVIYLILASISLLINGIIVLMIFRRVTKIRTPYLLLIFYFHISILGDIITALPYIFTFSKSWCEFNEPMKYYFSLMNIFIILLLVQGNRVTLTLASDIVVIFEKRVIAYIVIFLLPCISFLPYATDYYQHGNTNNPFCAVIDRVDSYWPIIVQYFWIWLVNLLNFTTNAYLSYVFFRGNHSPQLRHRFFFGIGGYSFIAILAWICRSVAQFSLTIPNDDDHTSENEVIRYQLFRFYPLVIASLVYAILFFINRKTILLLERAKSTVSNDTLSISIKELLDIVERSEGKSLYESFKCYFRGSAASVSSSMASRLSSEADNDSQLRHSNSGRIQDLQEVIRHSSPTGTTRTMSANPSGIALQQVVVSENPLHNPINA